MNSSPASQTLRAVPAPVDYRAHLPARRPLARQALPWLLVLAALAVLPLLFSGMLGLSVLTQMCVAATFALAYNMLLGGTGLLSFGHALYFGIGAYTSAHLLNAWGAALPLMLLPLAGALAGLLAGGLLATFTVRHDKTIYAMISLAIGQLVYSAATIMDSWSGGDSGIRLSPADANGWGFDFGDPRTLYYLVAAWSWAAALAMFALRSTPLGRLMNATRDNAVRVAYVGFSPVGIRGLALTLSAGFAGLAGSLYALSMQVVTTDTFGLPQATVVMLHTYIGGFTSFAGPAVGAVLMTFVSAHLSALSEAWPLYMAAFFIVVTVFWQHGLTGAVLAARAALPRLRGRLGNARLAAWIATATGGGAMALLGFVLLVEMVQSWSQNGAIAVTILAGPLAFDADPGRPGYWLIAVVLLAAGVCALRLARTRLR
jgi:branched-chain amino acid transport system permease protein